jgi:hypothetical protein
MRTDRSAVVTQCSVALFRAAGARSSAVTECAMIPIYRESLPNVKDAVTGDFGDSQSSILSGRPADRG